MAVNQRRSYDGNLCTIRYVGPVESTAGTWLGVEWDNPARGKHSGEHNGVRYFTCLNKHTTAGSFVRPSRPADESRGFLEALREKYASEFQEQELARRRQLHHADKGDTAASGSSLRSAIEFNGKVVEEVGFDKIRKQLAELQELKIVLLDGLRVAGVLAGDGTEAGRALDREEGVRERALQEVEETCPKITELDLSRCLVTRWKDVADICGRLERLRVLKLNGNRFGLVEEGLVFGGITELHLNETLLSWRELSILASQFPSLTSLSVSMNQITTTTTPISETITTLLLDQNDIDSLSSIRQLATLPKLERLSLRGNQINTITHPNAAEPIRFPPTLTTLDLSSNEINTWSFINAIPLIFPSLHSLRISGNPLYNQPVAPAHITNALEEKPMTVDEAYMLTLARLSSIQVLNYGNITPQDRGNGELYYLSLVGKEISVAPEEAENAILAAHPRYHELCEKYGEPVIRRAGDSRRSGAGEMVNPRSVAARLVKIVFRLPSTTPTAETVIKDKEVPLSYDTYQVKAIVSRLFGLPPFEFRLIWETDELDPVSKESMEEDDWDSDDGGEDGNESGNGAKFVRREVELVDSTRDIGFWFQDIGEARIRVDLLK